MTEQQWHLTLIPTYRNADPSRQPRQGNDTEITHWLQKEKAKTHLSHGVILIWPLGGRNKIGKYPESG